MCWKRRTVSFQRHRNGRSARPLARINDDTPQGKKLISDDWIYIQEPDVMLGRLQVFNNWSPFMVADPANVWLGLEYFCTESDEIWNLSDERMAALASPSWQDRHPRHH